eukprot:s1367_g6.t1
MATDAMDTTDATAAPAESAAAPAPAPAGPETPQCTPPATPVEGEPPKKAPKVYVPPPTPWQSEAQKELREKNVISACSRAKPVVKKLFDVANTQNRSTSELDTSQVTLLSCYYVQQYYHPNHEVIIGERDSYDVVALGCIFVACKVADHARRIKNLVRAYNQVLQEEKKPELSDEQQTQLVEKILRRLWQNWRIGSFMGKSRKHVETYYMFRIEFLVLKAVAFHFDVLMPLEYLDQQTDRLVEGLFNDPVFTAAYPYDRKYLRKNLYNAAMKFCVDGYSGNPALSKCVKNLSLASLVFATRYLLRSRTTNPNLPKVREALEQMPDLMDFMVDGEMTPEHRDEVNKAIEGIMQVFRQRRKG